MGQVFTTERVAMGDYPEHPSGLGQHEAAHEIARRMTVLGEPATGHDGAPFYWQVYGSAIYANQANRRSDTDFLSVVDHLADPNTISQIDSMVAEVGEKFRVPIGHSRMDSAALAAGGLADPFYVSHLMDARIFGGLSMQHKSRHNEEEARIFGHIFYEPDIETAITFADADLNKRQELFARLAEHDQSEADLRYPFELPRNLGRKIADLYKRYCIEFEIDIRYDPVVDELIMPDGWSYHRPISNFEIVLSELAPDEVLSVNTLRRLAEFDVAYSEILEDTIAGRISLADYAHWLDVVRDQAFADAEQLLVSSKGALERIVEMAGVYPEFGTEEFVVYGGSDIPIEEHEYGRRPKATPEIIDIDLETNLAVCQ